MVLNVRRINIGSISALFSEETFKNTQLDDRSIISYWTEWLEMVSSGISKHTIVDTTESNEQGIDMLWICPVQCSPSIASTLSTLRDRILD